MAQAAVFCGRLNSLINFYLRNLQGHGEHIQENVMTEPPDSCAAIRNYICPSFSTGITVKTDLQNKDSSKKSGSNS